MLTLIGISAGTALGSAVISQNQAEAFQKAYDEASGPLLASGHCLRYDVSRCSEDPEQFIVRIEWDSAEGHLQGFRGGPQFQEFFGLVRPFVTGIEEMRHYEPVLNNAKS